MSVHALVGLLVLNLLFLVSGTTLLWLLRGFATWVEVGRLSGVAYLCGLTVACALWTVMLIVGLPFSAWVVGGVPAAVAVGSAVWARRRGRAPPVRAPVGSGAGLVMAAIGIAAACVLLEAFFRSARLAGVQEWDAWSFWVPKGKAIYLFGGLDEHFFTTLPGASYPPLVPALDAAAFHAMGGIDVVTLHVQYWFVGVGFVWALAGLLSERASAWLVWPFVLLGLVAPRVGGRLSILEADLLLDYLFVVASVLILFWLLDRERWTLVGATILLCGMVLTKREGLLLVTLLFAATLLASARLWRTTWPALGMSGAIVVLVALPWRIWYVTHDVVGEGPDRGFVPGDRLEWLWPAVRRALAVLWDPGYWGLIVPLAICALVLAALARAGTVVVFFGALLGLLALGGIWATWVFSTPEVTGELGGNFIIRFMGSAALLCVAASPLLLSAAWRTGPPAQGNRKA